MKKLFRFYFLIFFIFLIILFLNKKINFIFNETKNDKFFKIAILTPIRHPALEEIELGFKEEILKKIDAKFYTYNGNGNSILMKAQVEEAIKDDYDLICAIAKSPFILLKETSIKRKSKIPIVGCAVEEKQINKNLDKDRNFVVINDLHDFKKQIENLLYIYNFKKIILPYAVTLDLQLQVEEIEDICKEKNISLESIKIYNSNEIIPKINFNLNNNEQAVIMILKDNLIVSNIESIVSIARKNNILIYASDLNSVDKGADLAFGVSEYNIGSLGGKKAIELLNNKILKNDIFYLSDFKFKINKKEILIKNIKIDLDNLNIQNIIYKED